MFYCKVNSVLFDFKDIPSDVKSKVIGYEPADLTMHSPPQNCRGWVNLFRIGV